MIRYEDECVGCSALGFPCYGAACPNKNVPHAYCDECDEDVGDEELYEYDGEELCYDCLMNRIKIVWPRREEY